MKAANCLLMELVWDCLSSSYPLNRHCWLRIGREFENFTDRKCSKIGLCSTQVEHYLLTCSPNPFSTCGFWGDQSFTERHFSLLIPTLMTKQSSESSIYRYWCWHWGNSNLVTSLPLLVTSISHPSILYQGWITRVGIWDWMGRKGVSKSRKKEHSYS